MAGPLQGLRVLDLTRVLAGPWCSQNLADLGAEVIKVERPGSGDDTRAWGPPYLKDAAGQDTSEAAYYLAANRGKKSITLDLSLPEARAAVRRLAAASDVFMENYKVGDMARFGLAWENLKAVNPRLVYCSITGFGQSGPLASRPGYDFMIQGMGGLMSITGERDERPGGGPQKVGVAVADLMTGMYASVAILGALYHRERSGEGQFIDMALFDCQVAMLANINMNYLVSGQPPRRLGNAHANIVPYQVFEAADGHLILAVGNDAQFARFAQLAGCPQWASDERFASNAARVRHRDILVPLVAERLRLKPREVWLEALEAAGVPCGPINRLDEVFAQTQVAERDMRVDLPHPQAGKVPLVGSPMKLGATPVSYDLPPPLLGQHNHEILGGLLGLSAEEIDAISQTRRP
ncbi:MAG: CoA transferase [Burkholderiales bacterium]|nr:MAG: CoA transferase [Burkholderiales bacterium]CAG1004624.1 succinyl-CoA:mesaconate CoA transferase [Myxococcaceae bacterium]